MRRILFTVIVNLLAVLSSGCGDGQHEGGWGREVWSPIFQNTLMASSTPFLDGDLPVFSNVVSQIDWTTDSVRSSFFEKKGLWSWNDAEDPVHIGSGATVHGKVLTYRGLPVFGSFSRMALQNGAVWFSGAVPRSMWSKIQGGFAGNMGDDFPLRPFAHSFEHLQGQLLAKPEFAHLNVTFLQRGYFMRSSILEAAYEFMISNRADDLPEVPQVAPTKIIVSAWSGDILSEQPHALQLDGNAILRKENEVDTPALTAEILPALEGEGKLLNSSIMRVVDCGLKRPSAACAQLNTSSPGNYTNVSFNLPEYSDVLSYFALSRAMNWHRRLMQNVNSGTNSAGNAEERSQFQLTNSRRLSVYVRALVPMYNNETYYNALYFPDGQTGGGDPSIVIGSGWEAGRTPGRSGVFRYLSRDADVVMHEFGHHVLWRSLKNVVGESGALHEGFSDYFVYAITGRSWLAKSILPLSEDPERPSGIPLRHGNLPVTASAQYINHSVIHIAGQFWSSALWDLRVRLGAWQDGLYVADKIISDSVDFLPQNAGYYQAIAAIGKAAELFARSYGRSELALKKQIYEVFAARGYINPPDDTGHLPLPARGIRGELSPVAPQRHLSSSSSSVLKAGCGVIAAPLSESSGFSKNKADVVSLFLLVMGLLLPAGFARFFYFKPTK